MLLYLSFDKGVERQRVSNGSVLHGRLECDWANLRDAVRPVEGSSLGFLQHVGDASIKDRSRVPAPLHLAGRDGRVFRLLFYHPVVPNVFDFSVHFYRLLLRAIASFVHFTLAFVGIVARYFFTFAIASLADAIGRYRQALSVIITRLRATFALVERITVNAESASLAIGARLDGFMVQVLYFRSQNATRFVGVVVGANFVVVNFRVFRDGTFVPERDRMFTIALRMVFCIALHACRQARFL